MDERAHDDNTQGSESTVSNLTSLENDDTDDFGRLMVQNARDERRLNDALRGNVQPFRKARVRPHVGLTLENLERNNGANGVDMRPSAQVMFASPPSVGSSSGSDPAIRVPSEWGRKGRVRRDWMRTIASDDEQKPGTQQDLTPPRANSAIGIADVDRPLPSVEDSPLSHKSSLQGTPSSTRRRNTAFDTVPDWDFTLDLNEASLIASTPYLPRNTALDDIRQREIESLKEQAVTTSRLDRIRESSPEETRRPRSKPSMDNLTNGISTSDQAQAQGSSEVHLRKRTNSTKSLSKSVSFTVEGGEQAPNSPIIVYKSAETVGIVDRGIHANAQTNPQRPNHRREDSHELLRRLARVSSSTPSPGRIGASRSQAAPARQSSDGSQRTVTETPGPTDNAPVTDNATQDNTTNETVATAPEVQPEGTSRAEEPQFPDVVPESNPENQTNDIDDTPMPVDQLPLNAKTPVVTGAWVDTPAPRTTHRSQDTSRSPSRSPKKTSPSKRFPEKQNPPQLKEPTEEPMDRIRPTLPRSALEAIVEEAKANGGSRQSNDQYGDSTIDSLEDLMGEGADNSEALELDEDTLLGLGIPTGVPRNEAERQRQQELLHLHRMNERLRAARTSIRDASRGMKRVENRVEHVEEGSDAVRVVYRECPCAEEGHQNNPFVAMWNTASALFYDRRKPSLTWLSIALVALMIWYILESLACDQYCHKFYATSMHGFGVDWDAPCFPYVIPTVLYRKLLRPFCQPLWSFILWTWDTLLGNQEVRKSAARTAKSFTTRILNAHTQQTFEPDLRMDNDELI
ncbi:uncharacterized protein BDR25DRAFT_218840 [Lindgomyces ingoldianus]|uniref:Uncharacterized protein n=1 Tax=Lindgomyces ingoldianus TaxID=673940 RepID=A0ACB6R323_9PLEO|nr:uncharacterized protein BDR25DRAFT_218840 [Lindgomyces ingoldianus]KAF2473462.1 hypothetical protein BDR25DRAFT_218840 [Lindgomyces ingoldianus]